MDGVYLLFQAFLLQRRIIVGKSVILVALARGLGLISVKLRSIHYIVP